MCLDPSILGQLQQRMGSAQAMSSVIRDQARGGGDEDRSGDYKAYAAQEVMQGRKPMPIAQWQMASRHKR